MNHSTPGLPIQHQLPEFTQTHVHRVSDANQPSHPLSPCSSIFPSPGTPRPARLSLLEEYGCSKELASRLRYARAMVDKLLSSRSAANRLKASS